MSATDFREWIRYAEADLRGARLLSDSGTLFHLAAMHAQQSAEKAIKAAIVAQGHVPARTHDLDELLQRLDGDFPGMPPVAEVDALTGYAVDSRYPDDLPDVSEAEAREAIEVAAAVLVAVRAALGA